MGDVSRRQRHFFAAMTACLAVVLFPAASPAQQTHHAAEQLLAWEKRYPMDEPGGFFDDPLTGPLAKQSIPADLLKRIRTLYVNTPFERSGDVLFARLCRPHDCPSHHATLYLDARAGTLQVCLSDYHAATRRNRDVWVGKTVRQLDEGACTGDMEAYAAWGDAK
jgi:hypothetical protein